MKRYDRVVLAIVGILTFKFCLLYIEYNTNKGEDTNKLRIISFRVLNVFFIKVSGRV